MLVDNTKVLYRTYDKEILKLLGAVLIQEKQPTWAKLISL